MNLFKRLGLKIRDLIYHPLNNNQKLVISTDCSGSVGAKELDEVKVPNVITSYFTARVALMELMSVGAYPVAYTISNFIEDGWEDIQKGIKQALNELGINELNNIGSSETNFTMLQSAFGISFIGTVNNRKLKTNTSDNANYAVVGYPLVGNEVIEEKEKVLKLEDFKKLINIRGVHEIVPVGSKGIAYEMKTIFNKDIKDCSVDINKSGGPSTCVIISYDKHIFDTLRNAYGYLINTINIY